MTRRGSLIYYLAAWALGCFFMVLAVWFQNLILISSQDLMREATEGFLTLIVYGYLVRRAYRAALWPVAATNHASVEMQDSDALGSRWRNSCAAARGDAGNWQPTRCARAARGIMRRYYFSSWARKASYARDGG